MEKLVRATPEAEGISSRDLLQLVEDLDHSGSEMHGLMVMRHGKVIAEGWWAPYAPGFAHASQSLTKTVTGTAFGIAMGEGLLALDDRLVDIFPEYVPENSQRWLGELRMSHILTMSAGMETQPAVFDQGWIRKFFTMPIVHEPGSAFYYNSIACSMVGACIRKKTGLGLMDYLRPRLFEKIGISSANIRWYCHEDGLENGSGGIVTSTEDNARLIQLYLNGGMWGGERILPQEWVRWATKLRNNHFCEVAADAPPGMGYGGMMWTQGSAFYADGAMGQLAIGFPEKDLLISVNQTCADQASERRMRAVLFGFAAFANNSPMPEDPKAWGMLTRRLKTLALPAPDYAPDSPMIPLVHGRKCRITEGHAAFFAEDVAIFNRNYHDTVSAFGFEFKRGLLVLAIESESGMHRALAGLDGRTRLNRLSGNIPTEDVVLSANWIEENELALQIRWLEICRTRQIVFRFEEGGVTISSTVKQVGGFDAPPQTAFARWE